MRRKGFTLVELLITIALLGMVVMLITNMLIFGMRSHEGTVKEFDVQSQVRLVSEKVNRTIRNASGAYLLHKDHPLDGNMTEGWNYLIVTEDKKSIVEWIWSEAEAKHIKKVLVEPMDNVTFDLVFSKDSAPDEDRLLNYELKITVQGREIGVGSTLQSVNSLHVIDRSLGAVANTLAYRQDTRITDAGVAQAAVALVLDISGSMLTQDVGGRSRLVVMKEETIKLLDGLAENDNIYLSVSPFGTNANATTTSKRHTMMPLKASLIDFYNIINGFTTNNSVLTNTGDGMRRAFHAIKDFNDLSSNADKTTKNFMIILVDGDSNRSSLHELLTFSNIVYDNEPYPHTYLNPNDNRTYSYNRHYWESSRWRFEYTASGVSPYINYDRPVDHSFLLNGIEYKYSSWRRRSLIFWNWSEFTYQASPSVKYVNHNYNVDTSSSSDNTYYNNGRVFSSYYDEYVTFMGNQIQNYKNTRNDNISVFVIGFKMNNLTGIKHIADKTGATGPSDSVNYYTADTSEALKAVLDEIKFQINDKLWHIGGPN